MQIQETQSMQPTEQLPDPTTSTANKKSRIILPLIYIVAILILSLLVYVIWKNIQTKNAQNQESTLNSTNKIPIGDPTVNWKVYKDNNYSLKYPNNWTVSTNTSDNNQEILSITSPTGKVGIKIYSEKPLYNPYQGDIATNSIDLRINNNHYNTIEQTITENNITKTLVDVESPNGGINYHILYGTGYPVTSDQNSSYEEYINEKQTIFVIISSLQFITPTTTSNWKTYNNANEQFTIKYPPDWKIIEQGNFIGFGPEEINENTMFSVTTYNKSTTTTNQILSGLGGEFTNVNQNSESISFGGITATKITTTTSKEPEWYSQLILIDTNNKYYAISNNATTDNNRNDILSTIGKNYKLTFQEFYSTFQVNN